MDIYQAIGTGWTILGTAVFTVEVLYLAYVGLRSLLPTTNKKDNLTPDEIADMVRKSDSWLRPQ